MRGFSNRLNRVSRLRVNGGRVLGEQAVDETFDVGGVDAAVAVGVAGACVARNSAVEEYVDKELNIRRVDRAVAVHVAGVMRTAAERDGDIVEVGVAVAVVPVSIAVAVGVLVGVNAGPG